MIISEDVPDELCDAVEDECVRLAGMLIADRAPSDLSECWGRLQALSSYRIALALEARTFRVIVEEVTE